MESTKTATLLKDLDGFTGDASLYRLDPPLDGHAYVVVSATYALFGSPPGLQTYIFPSDADGQVTNWGELDGSYEGDLDHEKALHRAGYTVKA